MTEMEETMTSEIMGIFTFNKDFNAYEHDDGKVEYVLKIEDGSTPVMDLLARVEKVYREFALFQKTVKEQVAAELLDYKNDFWPEYDENDENLNWDDVDNGIFDVSVEQFEKAITLLYIQIEGNRIYCEFKDGELFGGHRIHSYFDYGYRLISADV